MKDSFSGPIGVCYRKVKLYVYFISRDYVLHIHVRQNESNFSCYNGMQIESNCTQLLKHPLATSLLNFKWTTVRRTLYTAQLVIYFVFVISLANLALALAPPSSEFRQ